MLVELNTSHRRTRAKASRRSASGARRSGRAGERGADRRRPDQGQDRGRRHRPDDARQGPARHRAVARVPGGLARARRRRASRRRRSTASRRTRWSRTARSTSPATSASATSRSSRRSASAAAPAAVSSATRRWRSRPGSARSWSRGGRASGPTRASRPWAQASARLADGQQWTPAVRRHPRPVDEIAMLTRRYMHEYGGTRDHLANVAIAFRKHAARNPDVDDGPQAADPRRLHERALDLRAAVPLRQLPRDRRRARGRGHVGGTGPRPRRTRPRYIHSFAQGLPPQHQTMTNYFTEDPLRGPGVDRGAGACGRTPTSRPPTCRSRSSTTRSAR